MQHVSLEESIRFAKLQLSNYKTEIIAALFSFILASKVLYLIDYSLLTNALPTFLSEKYLPLSGPFFKLLVWASLFVSLKTLFHSILTDFKKGHYYKFTSSDWPKKWIFHGAIEVNKKQRLLIVKWSHSGCLLRKYRWKDFRMDFSMQYLSDFTDNSVLFPQRSFGILFGAKDLANYFMIEIVNEGEVFYIKPHVRAYGDWEVIELYPIKAFNLDSFTDISLKVKSSEAFLTINEEMVFTWVLPTHVDFNLREHNIKLKNSAVNAEEYSYSADVIPDITMRGKHGLVGFRAHPGQGVAIKDLQIKRI
ncbi:hypothetical protein HYZ78_02695 [Candidatus Microgenomates bacterium]|nr:hypothetical protein [Candidatus Microgenomates bacterium]